MLISWVIGTYLLVVPVPDVVEEAPNRIFVAIDNLLLRPEVSGAKSWEIFEKAHNFHKIGLDL
jgi:hypothetical protein